LVVFRPPVPQVGTTEPWMYGGDVTEFMYAVTCLTDYTAFIQSNKINIYIEMQEDNGNKIHVSSCADC